MPDNRLVLIDSSVWIDYFRGADPLLVERVNRLLEADHAAVCGLVLTEILPFFRKEKEREEARGLLSALPNLPFRDEDWPEALKLQSLFLKAAGHPTAVPDLIVTTICITHKARLYTLDSHFKEISRYAGLILYC